jgi:hypothetical protein
MADHAVSPGCQSVRPGSRTPPRPEGPAQAERQSSAQAQCNTGRIRKPHGPGSRWPNDMVAKPACWTMSPPSRSGTPVASRPPRSAGSWSAILPASVIHRRFYAPILILNPPRSSAALCSVADRDNLPGSPRASRRRNTVAVVRSGHPGHHPGAARTILADRCLGAWADANAADPRPASSSSLIQEIPAQVQRRDRRRPACALDATGFFPVPASDRKRGNSRSLAKTIRGDSLPGSLNCGKASSGSCI